tara:strand:+ start:718 stop:1287 length:570 start_codon:yes stop_codon:yes gene_type:complete
MNTQNMNVTAAAVTKKRGRKTLWDTDYDAAVKRQHTRVMKDVVTKKARILKPLPQPPIKCEVVALLSERGTMIQQFIEPKVVEKEVKAPKRTGGRKSLWESDPGAAATRELDRYLKMEEVAARKVARELAKELKGLEPAKPKGNPKINQEWLAKEVKKAKKSKALLAAEEEIMALKAELDALKIPKHSY